jgi:hypothetical protein
MIHRVVAALACAGAILIAGSGVASACGGLVAPGHAEVLQKATTLAAWHGGYEHYVTGFVFAGSANDFGYIVPLPGVPVQIEKAGDWTLERLEREINPPSPVVFAAAEGVRDSAVQVLQRVTVDALDITVVRGGGADVAKWAAANGFDLSADAPTVLGAYSSNGAVFALATFNRGSAAREGLFEGQGTVVHFVIPTKAPWIPLRILALGKVAAEPVNADLFVLTDDRPWFAPGLTDMAGLRVVRSEPASASLLSDLRSDRGMGWLPRRGMWFTAMRLDTSAGTIISDLSIDGGVPTGEIPPVRPVTSLSVWGLSALVATTGIVAIWLLWRPSAPPLRFAA